jgi:hypothetical protein
MCDYADCGPPHEEGVGQGSESTGEMRSLASAATPGEAEGDQEGGSMHRELHGDMVDWPPLTWRDTLQKVCVGKKASFLQDPKDNSLWC